MAKTLASAATPHNDADANPGDEIQKAFVAAAVKAGLKYLRDRKPASIVIETTLFEDTVFYTSAETADLKGAEIQEQMSRAGMQTHDPLFLDGQALVDDEWWDKSLEEFYKQAAKQLGYRASRETVDHPAEATGETRRLVTLKR